MGIVEDEQRVLNNEGLPNDGPYHVEEVQFVNGNRSYNFKLYTNLPTHYTPALRNHENFSYGPTVYQRQTCVELSIAVWSTWFPRTAVAKQPEN